MYVNCTCQIEVLDHVVPRLNWGEGVAKEIVLCFVAQGACWPPDILLAIFMRVSCICMFTLGYVPVEASTKPPQYVFGGSSAGLRVPAAPVARSHGTPRVLSLPGKKHKASYSLPPSNTQWGHLPRHGFSSSLDAQSDIVSAQSSKPSLRPNTDYRYSQRHRFLVDKIHQQGLVMSRPHSAQN